MTVASASAAGWVSQDDHSNDASGVFSPVVVGENSGRTNTGLAFHRNYTGCRKINVALNAPDSVELVRYDADDNVTAVTSLMNIHMRERPCGRQLLASDVQGGGDGVGGRGADGDRERLRGHSSCTGASPPAIEGELRVEDDAGDAGSLAY